MSEMVEAGKVVGFHYTLRDDRGVTLDSSAGGTPLEYLHGAGNIIPGLEDALDGRAIGDHVDVVVESRDAYGDRVEGAVHRVPRAQFPEGADIRVGMQFGVEGPDGMPIPVWVTQVEPDIVTIDLNHPLAGLRLHFAVDVSSVRDASEAERQHGHPHHPGHEHHDED